MIVDDAYFLWFDQDQHRRGMTDPTVDETLELDDRDADKAPAPMEEAA